MDNEHIVGYHTVCNLQFVVYSVTEVAKFLKLSSYLLQFNKETIPATVLMLMRRAYNLQNLSDNIHPFSNHASGISLGDTNVHIMNNLETSMDLFAFGLREGLHPRFGKPCPSL